MKYQLFLWSINIMAVQYHWEAIALASQNHYNGLIKRRPLQGLQGLHCTSLLGMLSIYRAVCKHFIMLDCYYKIYNNLYMKWTSWSDVMCCNWINGYETVIARKCHLTKTSKIVKNCKKISVKCWIFVFCTHGHFAAVCTKKWTDVH